MLIKRNGLLIILVLTIILSVQSQDNFYRIMFYNAENLFDTKDDTLKNDDEFLPDSDHHWDNNKFYKKLNNTAKVIIGVGGWQTPTIVGLCEIENRYVLNQLVYDTPLKNFGYSFIHQESPDWRGIDVAMLYRKDHFITDTFFTIPVHFPFDAESKTRDILYVKGRLEGRDTLHIFINHWPSRYGGYLETKPKREFVAGLVRHGVDSLLKVNSDNRIVIMGDLNDGPSDESVATFLKAYLEPPDSCCSLVNLMAPYDADKSTGTLKYHETWDVFDQMIVSSNLLNEADGLCVIDKKAMIYKPDFLLEKDDRYLGAKPFRTYNGFEYRGGFSDHLPVYLDIKVFGE